MDHPKVDLSHFSFGHFEAFVSVADRGSFTAAGSQLGLSQVRVTQLVRELEEAIGLGALLKRKPRPVTLTPLGHEMIERIRELVDRRRQLIELVRDGREPLRRLRLGVSETIAQTWLSRFIDSLHRQHPRLALEVEVDISPQLGQRLLRQDLDLAFLLSPPSDPAVMSRPLCHYTVSFIAHPSLVPPERPAPVARLAQVPILTFSRNTQPYLDILQIFRKPGLPRAQLYACAALSPIVRMARDGVGIAAIPEVAVRTELEEGTLQRIETTARLRRLRFCASWLRITAFHASGEMLRISDMAKAVAAKPVR